MSKWTGWGLLLCFLCFPTAIKNGILSGLELGERILIPSIFPYLVTSGILVKTGGLEKISKKFRIGNLSEAAKEMLIPSLFCGYPTGARLPGLAYNNGSITKAEFTLLFLFANIPGFGFSVSYLGGIFGNIGKGFIAYCSFLLASLSLLCLFGKKLPNQSDLYLQKNHRNEQQEQKKQQEQKIQKNQKKQKISDALVESISESAQTMVSLLFFVCFFSSLIDLLKNLPLPVDWFPIGAAFLEITTGILLLAQSYPMETVIFFCGFSGLSVLFQSLYFDKNHAINCLRLFLGRIIYGIISVCYFTLLRLVFSFV